MEELREETLEYLYSISNLLNGQIRGAIVEKARIENLELIQMTIVDVFTKGYNLGIEDTEKKYIIKDLVKQIKESENDTDGH